MYRPNRREMLAATGMAAVAIAGSGTTAFAKSVASGGHKGAMSNFKVGTQFKATQPLNFSLMYDSNPAYPYNAKWEFWKALKDRTNVSFSPVIADLADYSNKVSLLIGAGKEPTLIPKTYHPAEVPFIPSGQILAVSDYTHLMPNYTQKVREWKLEPDLAQDRQSNGKYYLLPGLHQQLWVDYTLAFRYDILAKLNLPSSWPELYGQKVPGTWKDVHDVLKAMKPMVAKGGFPLSDRFSSNANGWGAGNLWNILGTAYGAPAGWGYSNATWNYSTNKYDFTGAMPQFKQVVEYLAQLVSEGLLDPESFTQTDDQAIAKFGSGKSFVMSCNAQTLVSDNQTAIKGIAGATAKKIPVPIGPMGSVNQGSRLENGVMIRADAVKNDDFTAMMQLIDWLWYSDDGEVFARWGIKGQTYTGNPLEGHLTLAPDVDWGGLNPSGKKQLQNDYGFYNGIFSYGGSTKLLDTQFPPDELAFQKVMNERKTLALPPPAPLSDEQQQQAQLWATNLQDYTTEQALGFVLGHRPLSQWNEYIGELKQRNMDDYLNLVTTAYRDFKKNHGG